MLIHRNSGMRFRLSFEWALRGAMKVANSSDVKKAIKSLNGDEGFFGRLEINKLHKILSEDEIPEVIAQGDYKNSNGILVATTKRLLFVNKGLASLKFEDFPYETISSIQYSTGLALGEITILNSGNKSTIKQIAKEQVVPFVEYIRSRSSKITDGTSSPGNNILVEQIKNPFWKKWWFWGSIIIVLLIWTASYSDTNDKTGSVKNTSSYSSDIKNKTGSVNKVASYSMEFDPEISPVVKDNTITINAQYSCPDGAIMQLMLISGDLNDMQSEETIVKNAKTSTKFMLKSSETQPYAISITFQFNADSIKQPKNVTDLYGTHGEKLEGINTQEAKFKDGSSGKNASKTLTIDYPSKEAVEAKNTELFNEAAQKMISASNGVILDVSRVNPGIYHLMVSNSWYLLSESEKQYIAEEMLQTFTKIGKNLDGSESIVLSIYDESMNQVASSKMFGGMKIKR